MRYKLTILIILLNFVTPSVASDIPSLLENAKQLILVISDTWDDYPAITGLYMREELDANWKLLAKFPSRIGNKGFGWSSMKFLNISKGPMKKEGDSKAPAGVFSLGVAFGFADSIDNDYPYIPLTSSIECVDDGKSKYYNRIIDVNNVEKDWNSSEKMREIELYSLGMMINFNTDEYNIERGSCVFLHYFGKKGTAGCTSFKKDDMHRIVDWVDKDKNPVIVQLPKEAYLKVKNSWKLPEISG